MHIPSKLATSTTINHEILSATTFFFLFWKDKIGIETYGIRSMMVALYH